MASLLVTNDFPPKLGGIQSYLWELWRRLPPDETTVLTARDSDASAWDDTQAFRIERTAERVLLPTRVLARRIDALAHEVGADVVFLDPMLPLGRLGRRLRAAPQILVLHGAEVTLPGHLPGSAALARRVLRSAAGVVAAGEYPAREATRLHPELRGVVIPPGVDPERFRPLDSAERARARTHFGLDPSRPLVVGVSRLVPRKGFDVLIDALIGIDGVQLAIAGEGRDRARLERRAAPLGDRARFLGRVDDSELPSLYGCADAFSMLCRDRWGGLEAEGFGIVFLEAAACGVPAVAGRSGGSHEAVIDGETGVIVEPRDVQAVRRALATMLVDDSRRLALGRAARIHAEGFAYDRLVTRLAPLARGDLESLAPLPR
jgi:phosphatidyl-myo-inositol dimannoside synthase